MAVLTIHHWDDVALGLAEMRRVALRQVLFTFDPAKDAEFWLVADYLPVWIELDEALPVLADIAQHLDVKSVRPVAVPADCTDGFGGDALPSPGNPDHPGARLPALRRRLGD